MRLIIISLFILVTSEAMAINFSKNSIEVEIAYVDFTLRNGGLNSIPLLIPGVMNPNLSPMGNSGVSLKIGQEVLFKYKGKKRILLVVTEDLAGQVVDVSKLLKERKNEIDSGKE